MENTTELDLLKADHFWRSQKRRQMASAVHYVVSAALDRLVVTVRGLPPCCAYRLVSFVSYISVVKEWNWNVQAASLMYKVLMLSK